MSFKNLKHIRAIRIAYPNADKIKIIGTYSEYEGHKEYEYINGQYSLTDALLNTLFCSLITSGCTKFHLRISRERELEAQVVTYTPAKE